MPPVMVTLDTSHFEMSPLNDFAPTNIRDISVTLDTSHFERSPLKEVKANMLCMSVTLDTSQFEISPSNDSLKENILLISVTRDTSHFPIGPCGPSTKKDSSKHVPTALLSSDLVCGENAVVGVRVGVRVRVMVIDRVDKNAVVGAIAVPLSSDYLRNKWDR